MSTSRSSASESESFAENDVSFEESVDDNSSSHNNPSSHHYHLHQQAPSPMSPQQASSSSRQKHYFENPNVRYVVHTNSSGSTTGANNISLMPNYQQMKGNSLLPSSQFGSQYFLDNNVIHRTYSYYNQPQASMPKYPANFKEFPGGKNPDIVSVRYIAQPAHPNGTLVGKEGEAFIYRNGPPPPGPGVAGFMPYPAPPQATAAAAAASQYQYGPYKDRRVLFGRESYPAEQSFYYPGSFYSNQAYEMGSQRVLNYDMNASNVTDPKHRGKPIHELIKQMENHEPISSQWNMSGGFGNSYGMNQKFYKELIDSSNQPNFNQFYSDNPNVGSNNNGNNKKDKNNYLGFVNANASNKKIKYIILSIVLALILLALTVLIVLGIVLPKQFYIQPANSRSASVVVTNLTLNATEPIKSNDTSLAKVSLIQSVNLTNETISVVDKTSLDLVSTTTLTTLADLTTTIATTTTTTVKNDTNVTAELPVEITTTTTSTTTSTAASTTTTQASTTTTTTLSTTLSTEDTTSTTTLETITTSEMVPSTTELITENDEVDVSSSSSISTILSTLSIASTTTPLPVNERLIFVDTTTTASLIEDTTTTTTESTATTTEISTTSIEPITTTKESTDSMIIKMEEIKADLIDSYNSTVINNSTEITNNLQPLNSTDLLQF